MSVAKKIITGKRNVTTNESKTSRVSRLVAPEPARGWFQMHHHLENVRRMVEKDTRRRTAGSTNGLDVPTFGSDPDALHGILCSVKRASTCVHHERKGSCFFGSPHLPIFVMEFTRCGCPNSVIDLLVKTCPREKPLD